jgi:hypothetical protein
MAALIASTIHKVRRSRTAACSAEQPQPVLVVVPLAMAGCLEPSLMFLAR